jgi:predicted kinase
VGAAGSGKTTLRERLVAAGLDPRRVVSLDDGRAALRGQDAALGRTPRPLQDYSLGAVRRAQAQQAALLETGAGYLADATHLRRRERVPHVRDAHAAGLPAVALLMPALPLEVLQARGAERSPERRVPPDVLARHVHRRGLLDADLLRGEGFDVVLEPGAHTAGSDRAERRSATRPPTSARAATNPANTTPAVRRPAACDSAPTPMTGSEMPT